MQCYLISLSPAAAVPAPAWLHLAVGSGVRLDALSQLFL